MKLIENKLQTDMTEQEVTWEGISPNNVEETNSMRVNILLFALFLSELAVMQSLYLYHLSKVYRIQTLTPA